MALYHCPTAVPGGREGYGPVEFIELLRLLYTAGNYIADAVVQTGRIPRAPEPALVRTTSDSCYLD